MLRVLPLVCIVGSLAKLPCPCGELDIIFVCTFGLLAKLPIQCLELDLLCAHSEVLPNSLCCIESWTSCVHIRKSCRLTYLVLRVGPLVWIFGSLAKLLTPCGELDILCAHSEVFPNSYLVLRFGPLVCTFGSLVTWPTPC
ncbi:hypothetical protein PoB_005858800 [Plakobranchus ocellatus]|uniref:Secreted protein n=1 Tax=Plakobranchus ocellatus TaxID=259542 RepID=A0AAV4CLL4_9GAST|nr:hypothetical protein PoB_005858800 [Plakobranchus ocellatus]